MKSLTNVQLAKELKRIRLTIGSIINQQFDNLLIEVEERLTGKISVQKPTPKRSSNKRRTKQEIYNYYLNK